MKYLLALLIECLLFLNYISEAQTTQNNPIPSTDNTFYILPLGTNVVDLPETEYRSECARLWQQLGKGNDYHKVGHMQVINSPNFLRNVQIQHEIGMPTGVIFDSQTHDHPDVSAVIKADFRCAQWPVSPGANVTDSSLIVTMPIWLFSSNPVGSNSRYCRKVKVCLENNTATQGTKVKQAMDLYPGTIVVLDGVIEEGSIQGGDYCPYAVTEFRDWLRHRGMYDADTGKYNADAAPDATIGTWMLINGKMRSQFYDDPSPANANGTGISFNQKFGTNFSSWTLKYWDLNAFNIPMVDQNTALYPQSGIGYTASGFDAPRVNNNSDYFKAWIWDLGTAGSPTYPPGNPNNPLFGFTQRATRNHIKDMFQILRGLGLPDKLMFAHQIPGENAIGHLNTSPVWTGLLPFNGNVGITNFWTINPNFMIQYTNTVTSSRGWGIFEWHPFPSENSGMTPDVHHLSQKLYDITLRDVTNYYNNGAHYLCIGWWWPVDHKYWPSNLPQTGYDSSFPVNDSRTADALRDFLASRPNQPYSGYKGDHICLITPSKLILNSISKTQITLQWLDNANGETAYLIERKSPGRNFVQIATAAANAGSFEDKGLNAGVKYTYRVRASQADTCFSGYSNEATTITFSDKDIVWNFNTSLENWQMTHNVIGTIENQTLHLTITGSDSYIYSANGLNINANQNKYVIINMKYDAVDYQSQLSAFGSQNTSIYYPFNPNNTLFSDNYIDMSAVSTWTGTINNLRIDPYDNASSGNIYYNWIRIAAGDGIDSTLNATYISIDTSKYYRMYSKNMPNNCLSISDNGIQNGSKVIINPLTYDNRQIWKLTNNGNGYYSILNANSGFALECTSPLTQGTNAQVWGNYLGDRQQWQLQPASSGYFHFIVMKNNPTYLLDYVGTNIQMAINSGSTSQEWTLQEVAPNIPPTISISSPSNTSYFSPAAINISSSASDKDGSITKVEFYNGSTKIGESTTTPFSFNWTNLLTGSYTISAVATDNMGASSTSSTLSFVVLPTTIWNFTSTLEGWNRLNSMTAQIANSIATMTITASDPYFYSPPINMSATDYNYIIVRMQNFTADTLATLYWTTTTSTGYTWQKTRYFPIIPNDTIFRYYILDLSNNPNWAGTINEIRIDPVANASSGKVAIDFIKFVGTFPTTITPIQGILEAENFDKGGQGNAYNDFDVANNGGQYRTNEGVDIQTCSDGGAGYNIGWIASGEWLEYLINSSSTTLYTVTARMAATMDANQFHIELDGIDKTGVETVNKTGLYQSYLDFSKDITIPSGIHCIRLVFDKCNGGLNFNKLSFVKKIIIQTIPLVLGLNLISINVCPTDSSITTLFSGMDVQEIKTYDAFWRKGQNIVFNSLNYIETGKGYLIKMNNAGTLTIMGYQGSKTLQTNTLHKDWNLIGCPYQSATSFLSIFKTSNVTIVKDFNGFWTPNGSLNSIQNIEPGKGYFIKD